MERHNQNDGPITGGRMIGGEGGGGREGGTGGGRGGG